MDQNDDKEKMRELIYRQSRTIVILGVIVFLLLTCVLLLSFCGNRIFAENTGECGLRESEFQPGKSVIVSKSPEGQKLFKQNCAPCHQSHNDQLLTGPGFKGIFDRVSEEYFIRYTLNYERVKKEGDAYANMLTARYDSLAMPIFEGQLSENDIKEIIKFLKSPVTIVARH